MTRESLVSLSDARTIIMQFPIPILRLITPILFVMLLSFALPAKAQTETATGNLIRPILRYEYFRQKGGKTIKISPTRLKGTVTPGEMITWQVESIHTNQPVATIRWIASGSQYSQTFTQALGADGSPRAVLKAVGAGRFNIRLLAKGKEIYKSTHTFFKKMRLIERNQVNNYIPSTKKVSWEHMKNQTYPFIVPFLRRWIPKFGERKAATLYVATEPINNKVDLILDTDLTWPTSSSIYRWAVFAPLSVGGATLNVQKIAGGRIKPDGQADVRFPPTKVYPFYIVLVGVISKAGTPNLDDYNTASPALSVIAIQNQDINDSKTWLSAEDNPVWYTHPSLYSLKSATFLITAFRDGKPSGDYYPGGDDKYQTELNFKGELEGITDPASRVHVHQPSLTHVAGETFDPATGIAYLTRFQFTDFSYLAKQIYKSDTFNEFLNILAKRALIKAKQTFPQNNANVLMEVELNTYRNDFDDKKLKWVYFPEREDLPPSILNQHDTKWMSVTFGVGFGNSGADLSGAINSGEISGAVKAYVRRVNGTYKVEKIDFDGILRDVYDFNYESVTPAPIAAQLQFGWRPSELDPTQSRERGAGKIWLTDVLLKTTKKF